MPPRKTTAPSVVRTSLKRRSGQLMGFLPLSVSLFPVGLPLRPTSVLDGCGLKLQRRWTRTDVWLYPKSVCLFECVRCMPESKFPFFPYTICKSEFAEERAPSVCFGFVSLVPRWGRSVDIALYCLFVECMCIRSALRTFPLNVGLCKNTATLASSAEQTTALSKYLPAPALSQLAVVDFRAQVQMRPGHVLMTSSQNKYVSPHTLSCI